MTVIIIIIITIIITIKSVLLQSVAVNIKDERGADLVRQVS